MHHETTLTEPSGHTPATVECACGWAQTGATYRLMANAQAHRLDALERRETVTYAWQRESAFTNPAPARRTSMEQATYCMFGGCGSRAVADGVHVGGLWRLACCEAHIPEAGRKFQTVIHRR